MCGTKCFARLYFGCQVVKNAIEIKTMAVVTTILNNALQDFNLVAMLEINDIRITTKQHFAF